MIPRYSKQEFGERGDAWYDRLVTPETEQQHRNAFILIDIETGDFEIDRDEIAASDRLLSRRPNAQVWMRRVGSRYAYRIGGFRKRGME